MASTREGSGEVMDYFQTFLKRNPPPMPAEEETVDLWESCQSAFFHLKKVVVFLVSIECSIILLLSWVAVYIVNLDFIQLSLSLPMDVVGLFCIVPMILGANIAFEKRETILSNLMGLKAQAIALHLSVQSWDRTGHSGQAEVSRVLQDFLKCVKDFCVAGRPEFSSVDDDVTKVRSADHRAYDALATLAAKIEAASPAMGHSGLKGGEANALSAGLAGLAVTWEQLKAARQNEPPRGLAHFTLAVSHVLPVLLAPYWSTFCATEIGHLGLTDGHGCTAAYFVSAIFTVAVYSLWRLQNELSDPFDGEGADDIPWAKWGPQIPDMGRFGPGRAGPGEGGPDDGGRRFVRMGQSLRQVRSGPET